MKGAENLFDLLVVFSDVLNDFMKKNSSFNKT